MKRPVARLLEPCREACGQSDIDNRCAGVTPLTVATTPSLGAGHVMKNARYSPAATTTTSCQILRIWRKVLQACGDWSLRPSVPSDASQGWLVHLTMEGWDQVYVGRIIKIIQVSQTSNFPHSSHVCNQYNVVLSEIIYPSNHFLSMKIQTPKLF